MTSATKNAINFRLRYYRDWGQAVYIVLNCNETLSYPIRMQCIEMQNHVWESGPIYFHNDLPHDQVIPYQYFTADFDDCQQNVMPVFWQGTRQIMQREFNRQLYHNRYVIKFDQCDQRKFEIDHQGIRQYKIVEDITIMNMKKLVRFRLTIIKGLAQGRWIYAMPIPDDLPESNPEDINAKRQFRESDFLKAERMQRYKTTDPDRSIWKMQWVFTQEQIEKLGGSHNIAFFQSYFYKRMNKYWTAILPSGQQKTMEQVSEMLRQANIPFQIQVVDDQIGQVIVSHSNGMEDLVKQKFIYQVEEEMNPLKIFEVFVISQSFGRQRMARDKNKSKLWQTTILIPKNQVQNIDYYFEINSITAVGVDSAVTSQYSMKDNYQPGRNLYVHQVGGIRSTQSYNHYSRSSNSTGASRRGGGHSSTFMRQNTRSHRSSYYNTLYRNDTPAEYRTYRSTQSTITAANSQTTNWPSSNGFHNTFNSSFYRTENESAFSSIPLPSHLFTNSSSKNRYSVSSSSSSRSESSSLSRMNNLYNFEAKKPNWYKYYSHDTTTSNNKQLIMQETRTNDSTLNSSTSTPSLSNQSSILNPQLAKININKNTTSNFNRSTVNLLNKSSTFNQTQTGPQVHYFVNNVAELPKKLVCYRGQFQSIFNMPQTQFRYVKVGQYLNPIKIQLVKSSEIKTISDNFEKQRAALIAQFPQISNLFVQLKQLRKKQDKSQDKIVDQNLKIFTIQLTTAAKSWGKNKYVQAGEKNIMSIVQRYFPELTQSPDLDLVFSIIYYVNDATVKEKYYEKVTHGGVEGNCQGGFRDAINKKFQQLIIKGRKLLCFDQIKDHLLYKSLMECIRQPFEQIKKSGEPHGAVLNWTPISQMLMRILIQYSSIYSIGRQFLDKSVFTPFGTGCGEFDPFCQETGEFTNTFLLSTLENIKNLYMASNKSQAEKIMQNKHKMVEFEKQVLQKIEDTAGKKALELINISFDLEQLSKQFQKTDQILVTTIIDLENSEQEYVQQLQKIDKIERPADRMIRVRSLIDHKYLKTVIEATK